MPVNSNANMSKTKEEYMELAYKDGLAGLFEPLIGKASLFGKFETISEAVPECAITSYKVHDAKTLSAVFDRVNGAPVITDPLFPVGLELDDLLNAIFVCKIPRYLDGELIGYVTLMSHAAQVYDYNVAFEDCKVCEVLTVKFPIKLIDSQESDFTDIFYDRVSGFVSYSDDIMTSWDSQLQTYLDSLS
jgi:hypothetical protein